jgi:acid phosphatase type 7
MPPMSSLEAPSGRWRGRGSASAFFAALAALWPLAAVAAPATGAPVRLLDFGARWRTVEADFTAERTWAAPNFDDRGWTPVTAGREVTQSTGFVSHFRTSFVVPELGRIDNCVLKVLHDDGAALYLNGTEVYRAHLPAGALAANTPADRETFHPEIYTREIDATLCRKLLRPGENLLAARTHQRSLPPEKPTRVSFDVALLVNAPSELVRGPYLQRGTPNEATIKWRTTVKSRGRVVYGPAPGAVTAFVDEAEETTEHEVRLTGLTPETRYFYSIGTETGTFAGGDAAHFFKTPPRAGERRPTRIWAIGDAGTHGRPETQTEDRALEVYRAYEAFRGDRHTDVWLMLGDNAYDSGTDAEYGRAVFDVYRGMLPNTFLWSTLGNHETYGGAPFAYFDIFTFPTQAEAGGIASGTEHYYSFDHGDIHFVVLDSMISQRRDDIDGLGPAPMLTWLKADLEATDKTWVFALFHHPPYTMGNHRSDNDNGFDQELVDMREAVLPILENYGVDLVLSGHSHSYERSYFLDGHYDYSYALDGEMKRDHGSGKPDDTGAYAKSANARGIRDGAVYVVAGSGGKVSPPLFKYGTHPAMRVSLEELGSLVIDVDGGRLHATFLSYDRSKEPSIVPLVRDEFVIEKGVPPATTPPAGAPEELEIVELKEQGGTLRWRYEGRDETGFVIERALGTNDFLELARVGANATSYTGPMLTAGRLLRYRVRGRNAAGLSPPSNVVELRQGSPGSPDDGAPLEPGAAPGETPEGGPDRGTRAFGTRGGGCECGVSGGHVAGAGIWLAGLAGVALLFRPRKRKPRGRLWLVFLVGIGGAGARPAAAHDEPTLDLAKLDAQIEELAHRPEAATLLLDKADVLRRLGRYPEALATLERVDRALPPPAVDLVAAKVLAESGQKTAALARLDRAVAEAPRDANARFARGHLLLRMGQADRAAQDFAHAVRDKGASARPDDHLLLVRALRAADRRAAAQAALTRARTTFGPIVTIELEAIDLLRERRRFDEALAHIDELVARSARPEPWLLRRAELLAEAGRTGPARRAFVAVEHAVAERLADGRSSPALREIEAAARAGLARLGEPPGKKNN